ncbi:fatty acid elongase [Coemansia reversa NRRL 1564]|uniref:Elongation of fatty acids protein n=1 Tax=Coemansia reversa (strain ATCC 12441 / NRRL 1564) TaxID=763665 RepID=A0A2G5BF00_COERN|nr:fatty acid elongase [Coemansia reversa NRRL 1564]|eukprot:PIA17590.1 fatty acid elongase [Coemansia reversa NRRL 1564]
MANIQLPAGTTVNLENVPLHQFYHLSLHPATPVIIVAVYTLIVHALNSTRSKTLSRIEARRQDLKLGDVFNEGAGNTRRSQNGPWMTATVVLHNLALAAFSYWCATNYTTAFFQTVREEGMRCAYCDMNHTIWNNMFKFNYLFYLSKYYELIDTFIILAKGRKATFLQTYHHAGAIMTMWVGCYFGSPQLIFYVVENSIIHTLMYTYFALTAMGYSPPGKKYLTHLQIFQFLIGLVFIALYITIPGCLTPLQRNLLFVMLSYLIPLIYLFVDFSIKTYGKKNKAKTL